MSTQPHTPATRPAKKAATPLSDATKLLLTYAQLEQEISGAKDLLKEKQQQQDDIKARLQAWSEANAGEFGGKKSLGLSTGTIGFKAGPRKLVLSLDVNLSWYLTTVKALVPAAVKETVDAKLLISGLDHKPELAKVLRKRGIEVSQEDYFYISLKK